MCELALRVLGVKNCKNVVVDRLVWHDLVEKSQRVAEQKKKKIFWTHSIFTVWVMNLVIKCDMLYYSK